MTENDGEWFTDPEHHWQASDLDLTWLDLIIDFTVTFDQFIAVLLNESINCYNVVIEALDSEHNYNKL